MLQAIVARLIGEWQGATDAYAAAAAGGGGGDMPALLRQWIGEQREELHQLLQQQQQQQQQQQRVVYTWQRARSLSRMTSPGGDGSVYISIVMVGRHDNTQVQPVSLTFSRSVVVMRVHSFASMLQTRVLTAQGLVTRHTHPMAALTRFEPPHSSTDQRQASGLAWMALLQRHNVSAELLYVEWNPYVDPSQYQVGRVCFSHCNTPTVLTSRSFFFAQSPDDVEESREDYDAPSQPSSSSSSSASPTPEFVRLSDFFQSEHGLPALGSGPRVRVISVPLDVHERFWNPYDFDLLEFIGKNVAGIRPVAICICIRLCAADAIFFFFDQVDGRAGNSSCSPIPTISRRRDSSRWVGEGRWREGGGGGGVVGAAGDYVCFVDLLPEQVFARRLLKEDNFYGGFRGVVLHHVS